MGKRIQKGWKDIQLDDGTVLDVNMEIQTVGGLGGHSSQQQMLDYLRHFKNKPRKIITNHGDSASAVELARTIHKMYNIESAAPRNLETIRLR
jgi:predicted metal-dependent RNase